MMASDYYKIKALSHSMLSCLAQNPMECRMRYVDDPPSLPPKDSAAFAMGHAVHCLALEPDEFEERFVSFPKVDRRTKEGKEFAARFEAENKGKIILDPQEFQDAMACVQALNNHPEFATIMAQPRRVEVPFEFDLFGHRFKAKPDCIVDSMRLILDIKTTDDASPHRWQWSAVDYGYHRQAFIYQGAIELSHANKEPVRESHRFIFAVVEKPKPSTRGIPPTVALYELDAETMRMGAEDTFALVREYERRLEENDWQQPYSSGIVPLRLPKRRVYEGE
jgi:exodeoxyribonuclease VIII